MLDCHPSRCPDGVALSLQAGLQHLLLRLLGTSSPKGLFSAVHNFVKAAFQTKFFHVSFGVCLCLNSLRKVSARTVCLPRTRREKNTLFFPRYKNIGNIFFLKRCSCPTLGDNFYSTLSGICKFCLHQQDYVAIPQIQGVQDQIWRGEMRIRKLSGKKRNYSEVLAKEGKWAMRS